MSGSRWLYHQPTKLKHLVTFHQELVIKSSLVGWYSITWWRSFFLISLERLWLSQSKMTVYYFSGWLTTTFFNEEKSSRVERSPISFSGRASLRSNTWSIFSDSSKMPFRWEIAMIVQVTLNFLQDNFSELLPNPQNQRDIRATKLGHKKI